MSVTVVSCVYGPRYASFFRPWWNAVQALDPAPNRVILAGDGIGHPNGPEIIQAECGWRYPQAFYLQQAIEAADTDWVWVIDIDDIPHRDGLAGLADVDEDVWQMGFHRSDGETYVPPQLTATEVLASEKNVFVAGSAFRREAFLAAGGFPDVALQDWAVWRRLARNDATFKSSGRTHFHYMRHPHTRGATELTADVRSSHLREMLDSEALLAA